MARIRTPNFHDARLSVAQSCIRELVAKRAPGAPASGLFAAHPMMQAAGAVLEGVHRGEVPDGTAAVAAYRERRAAQTDQGMAVAAAEGVATDCLDLLTEYALAWAVGDTGLMGEIASEWKESPCDATGWLEAVDAWLDYYGIFDGRAPRYAPPLGAGGQDQAPYATPGVFPLPAPASADGVLRVGVLGDWGTGEPEALAVLDQLMQQAPDLIVHVGDVYYAGTEDEQTSNFLDPILAAQAKYGVSIPVYTLPGNHDYYSGGAGFYGMIPELNASASPATVQTNSFFCLRNDAWQLQGMDTGYYDSDLLHVAEDTTHLRDDEAAWHQQQLAGAGSRAVVLFSHHQLFSAFEKIGGAWQNPALEANLAAWRGATGADVVAWLWGHEHVLEIYAAPGAGSLPVLGRCVGNGAFPVFTDSGGYSAYDSGSGVPVQPAETSPGGTIVFPDGYVQSQPDDLVWASGFTLLELGVDSQGRPAGTASYYQVQLDGSMASSQLLWQECIPAAASRAADVSQVVVGAKVPAGN